MCLPEVSSLVACSHHINSIPLIMDCTMYYSENGLISDAVLIVQVIGV